MNTEKLPEDPTSFEGLTPASMVIVHGFAAYQRDPLSALERDVWDRRVEAIGGRIVRRTMTSEGLRPGRRMARDQTVSYYLVPDPESSLGGASH